MLRKNLFQRQTNTSLDQLQERTIGDMGTLIENIVRPLDWCDKIHIIEFTPKEVFTLAGDRLTEQQVTTRPERNLAIAMVNNVKKVRSEKLLNIGQNKCLKWTPNEGHACEENHDECHQKFFETRAASAMPCKVTTPANVEDSSWRRPQATTSKKDYEEVVAESLRFQLHSWIHVISSTLNKTKGPKKTKDDDYCGVISCVTLETTLCSRLRRPT